MENQPETNRDLIIELRTEMKEVRKDIFELKNGTIKTQEDHEKRIRALEDKNKEGQGVNKVINSMWGAASGGIIVLVQWYLSKH